MSAYWFTCQPPVPEMERLSDLDVHKELIAVSNKLDAMAELAMSVRSRTALRAASKLIRKLASALFKASF